MTKLAPSPATSNALAVLVHAPGGVSPEIQNLYEDQREASSRRAETQQRRMNLRFAARRCTKTQRADARDRRACEIFEQDAQIGRLARE